MICRLYAIEYAKIALICAIATKNYENFVTLLPKAIFFGCYHGNEKVKQTCINVQAFIMLI